MAGMSRRKARLIFSLLVTLIIAATVLVTPKQGIQNMLPAQTTAPGFYKVTKVYDGDTIAVAMNNTEEKVRLIGVDTPETHKPDTPVQCFGPQASDFSTNALQGQNVRLEADPLGDNRDRYDRLLRYVYLADGTLWDKKLIEQGYGFAYLSFPFSHSDEFAAAQTQAQAEHKGLWATCQPTYKSGRWQSN